MIAPLLAMLLSLGCTGNQSTNEDFDNLSTDTKMITNEKMKEYPFLEQMEGEDFYPQFLVERGKGILVQLCLQIEQDKPQTLDDLYVHTHAATDKFNDLEIEFFKNDSEIETIAREAIGADFDYIAKAYGFANADGEELIGTRNW